MLYQASYRSPLGPITLAARGDSLVGLWLEGQKYFGGTRPQAMTPGDDLAVFADARRWLDAYFAGHRPGPGSLTLAPEGSPFRQAIWQLLCAIPYGQVVTYGQLAARLGRDTLSAQAVGGAVGHNPISIIIPCHRVVGAGGSLTGYAGGVERKLWLLRHEGADTARLKLPTRGTAL